MSTNRFTSWSSARFAIGTAAVASLAVIAACTDGSIASNIAAPSLRFGRSVGPSIANASLATICATGPNGTYTFQNSAFTQGALGTTVLAGGIAPATYTLIINGGNPNPCIDVMTRTSGTTPSDAMSAVTVTNTATPAGIIYSTTNCVDDPGVDPTVPCAQSATIHANRFHGSRSTFVFALAPVTGGCTYTFGWYKNHGNASVPTTSFFGTAASWQTVIATKPGGNNYYNLADQYIPAKLNVGAGTPPAAVAQALLDAEAFFTGRALGTTTGYSTSTLVAIAAVLDNFNNGNLSSWPHCP